MAYNLPYRISLIQTLTASSSSSLAFTSGISANFSTYMIKIRKVVAGTNATQLLMTWSTDGGSTYLSTNYLCSNLRWTNSTTRSYLASGSTSSIQVTPATMSSTSTRDVNGDIILYNVAGTLSTTCMYHMAFYNSSAVPVGMAGGGMNTGTTAINAIKFAMNSGNIASGTISLYGLNDGGFIY